MECRLPRRRNNGKRLKLFVAHEFYHARQKNGYWTVSWARSTLSAGTVQLISFARDHCCRSKSINSRLKALQSIDTQTEILFTRRVDRLLEEDSFIIAHDYRQIKNSTKKFFYIADKNYPRIRVVIKNWWTKRWLLPFIQNTIRFIAKNEDLDS